MKKFLCMFLSMLLLLTIVSCKSSKEVVIYTSVDQIFAEKLLKEYEETSGIKVKAVYDVEATKTVGLANRLIAEKDSPAADVFWSGEFLQTIVLANEGVLEGYISPSSSEIPDSLKDSDGLWTAFAGRARILFVNTDLVKPEDYPDSIFDLIGTDRDPTKIAMAFPMFGTTLTHAAALYSYLGEEDAVKYYKNIKEAGVRIVDGNSVVRDLVASGQVEFGITDTDDACTSVLKGDPVKIIIPDQNNDTGVFIIPNTAALIKGGPNPEEGKKLIDYLVSKEFEKKLIEVGWSHIPVRKTEMTTDCIEIKNVKTMNIPLEEIFRYRDRVTEDLTEIFVR